MAARNIRVLIGQISCQSSFLRMVNCVIGGVLCEWAELKIFSGALFAATLIGGIFCTASWVM